MAEQLPFTPFGQQRAVAELKRATANFPAAAGGSGTRTLLFAGPDHVGRRLAARWLAAFLNCAASDESARPCGACESCLLLSQDAHPDFKLVEPALTTGGGRSKRRGEIRIDQLVRRERGEPEPLGPWLLTRPRYRARLGVIDSADSMNIAAANSFLKMLEEPPAWSFIVLIAPGPDALLPTVASRCSVVRFTAVDVAAAGVSAPEGLEDHPGVRLGQPGALLRASEQLPAATASREAAAAFLEALSGDLLSAVSGAEQLAKSLGEAQLADAEPDPLGWLRELLRDQPLGAYAAALEALERCEEALAAYGSAPLALSVLALELRVVLGFSADRAA